MSSAERAARLIIKMEPGEFRVLLAIELGMASYSFVPLDEVVKYSGLKQGEVVFRLRALDRKDLLYRQPEPYPGYILNYTAYDCLALNASGIRGERGAMWPGVVTSRGTISQGSQLKESSAS
jgi:RIO-like serine/threonine protein kinase